jgi:hypothetical protein
MANLLLKVANNASGQLAAGIADSDLSLSVKAGEGLEFPDTSGDASYFYVTLQKSSGAWEVVKVTERSTDTFTIVRNQDSSTGSAQAFSADDIVSCRPCQQVIEDIIDHYNGFDNQLYAPSGTKMVFYQNSAPTGWTIDGAVADCILAVKGGTQAYDANAGQILGTWTQPNHTHSMGTHIHTMPTHTHTMPSHSHTGPSHTHTGPSHIHTMGTHVHSTGNHALSIAEMPVHTHAIDLFTTETSSAPQGGLRAKIDSGADGVTESAGSGSSHNHGNTGSTDPGDTNAAGTGATGASGTGATSSVDPGDTNAKDPGDTNATDPGDTNGGATANTWRPYAALTIVATKD